MSMGCHRNRTTAGAAPGMPDLIAHRRFDFTLDLGGVFNIEAYERDAFSRSQEIDASAQRSRQLTTGCAGAAYHYGRDNLSPMPPT